MAWLCTALMLVTITLSAFMRLSQAGLGCDDWPACYGQNLRDLQQGAPTPPSRAVAAARLAHRVVASLTLVVVVAMVMTALTTQAPLRRRDGALALALLVLALALASLGVVTPGARLPAVAMGNLLGGFAMLALCWQLAAGARTDTGDDAARLGVWAVAGLALLCGQLASGALVSASYAALSCTDLADCWRAAAAAGQGWEALNPWREPVFRAGAAPADARGAGAMLLHRVGAIVVLPVLALLGIAAWRGGRRRAGGSLVALAAAQLSLGLLIVAADLPLAAVLMHSLVAALLLAALMRLV